MRHPKSLALLAPVLVLLSTLAAPGAEEAPKFNILKGPATARMLNIAQIKIPAGYFFVDGDATRKFFQSNGDPVSGNEVGMISSTTEDWSVVFEFDEVGYVKDEDKDKLDADKLLAQIREGTEEANRERERHGSAPVHVVGWEQPPHYNPETHNLEWAVRGTCEDREILNYNTRLLGRKGVMEVVLIVSPQEFAATLPKFKGMLADYSFESGQSYAEYKPGDKVAKYGLAALIVGGAAVGAAKLGLFSWIALILKKAWPAVVAGFAAVVAFFKRMFNRVTGRRGGGPDMTGGGPGTST